HNKNFLNVKEHWLLYTWKLNANNFIIASIKATSSDRDGDARDYSQSELKIGHLFNNANWLIASNVFASTSVYDEKNPIFDEYQDAKTLGGSINLTYKKPFGWEDWNLNMGVVAVQSNSDIEFYDSSLVIGTFGFVYVF
ncbi:MAG TPA: DUF2860 domain-containing protein, partial [Sulfurimonas sp.]|nr:DUF2860 domain-containing protein [Sulfurimonas sp.]